MFLEILVTDCTGRINETKYLYCQRQYPKTWVANSRVPMAPRWGARHVIGRSWVRVPPGWAIFHLRKFRSFQRKSLQQSIMGVVARARLAVHVNQHIEGYWRHMGIGIKQSWSTLAQTCNGTGNGLLPDSTKPLSEPTLIDVELSSVINHSWGIVFHLSRIVFGLMKYISYLISSCLALSGLALSRLISSHLISSHLILSYLRG